MKNYQHQNFMACMRKSSRDGANIDKYEDKWIRLAGAILARAADDYVDALITDSKALQLNLERFFLSKWGQELSFAQGEIIIRECRRIAEERRFEYKEKRKRDIMTRKG